MKPQLTRLANELTIHPKDNQNTPLSILLHDGKELFRGTSLECWQWIHRNHSYSVDHATKYEGYQIKEISR